MNDIEQIEKYLAGELSKEELQAFEQRLQTDTAFAETFKLYQSVEAEMKSTEDEEELRTKLSSLTKKHFTEDTQAKIIPLNRSRKRWWMYTAAAAAAIIILLVLNPWQQKALSNAEVYAQNATIEDLPTVVRGSNEDTLKIKATELFNKKQYAAALPLLDSITKLKPGEAQLQLSLGLCYLDGGNYTMAVNKFDSLAEGESIYKYDAIVWKALVFLKQERREECIAVLKQIPESAAIYKKAEKMIKQLSR